MCELTHRGAATVQDAERYTSEVQEQDAAVRTAQDNLALARRQITSLHAQRLSAEASVAQTQAQLRLVPTINEPRVTTAWGERLWIGRRASVLPVLRFNDSGY
jgi:hypothetical protein